MQDSAPLVVTIGDGPLSLEQVHAVAHGEAGVALALEVGERLRVARGVVERSLERGDAIYGLTTGLGAAVDTRLAADQIAAFQQRAVRARAVGVGPCLTQAEVRAMLLVRLAGLAQGASGISPVFAETIAAMLNARLHPVVRRIGSLGEADLSPLAQVFLPLVGEGEAEFGGRVLPGADAMRAAGIAMPEFGPKDGLALLNANAESVGLAALALHEVKLALGALTVAGALSLEAYRANLSPIAADLVALRPVPSQVAGSVKLRALLAGSDLFEAGAARRVQDPLSFRCLAPVNGAALAAFELARELVEIELNGAGDSPAVLAGDDTLRSTVNFDTTALALAFEGLGLAAAHAAAISAFRVVKLMSPASSDLPRFLTRHGGSHAGFATTQKTASVLEAEIRHLALPLGPMTMPVADGVEDYAPMTPRVVEKTTEIARRLLRLAAIELVVAAEAVDLREGIRLGAGTGLAHAFIRRHVAPLDDDRPMGREYEALAERLAAGELATALEELPA
ncbi:HAL/PAL/TAL family ammonia-lyase [Bosea caraganae]|nr:aromatic amino acid lyase [Bosea caraganae]